MKPRMTNKELRRRYLAANRKHFRGKLNRDVEVKFGDTKGQCVAFARRNKIVISEKLKSMRCLVIPTLYHEMIHIEHWDDWAGSHGPRFNTRMLQLAKAGAFNGWW